MPGALRPRPVSLDAVPLLVAGMLLLLVASRKFALVEALSWVEVLALVVETGVGVLALLRPRSWSATLAYLALSMALFGGALWDRRAEEVCNCLGAETSTQSRWLLAAGLVLMGVLAVLARAWGRTGNR